MRKKIVAIATALFVGASITPVLADPPPRADCSFTVGSPKRVSGRDSGKRLIAITTGTRPVILPGDNTVSQTSWVEVWAPDGKTKNGGKWHRYGNKDYDFDHQVAVTVNGAVLLRGMNKYRTVAETVCVRSGRDFEKTRYSFESNIDYDPRPFGQGEPPKGKPTIIPKRP